MKISSLRSSITSRKIIALAKKNKAILVQLCLGALLLLFLGAGFGLALGKVIFDSQVSSNNNSVQLRLPGQKYTSPLLACNRLLSPNVQGLSQVQSNVEKIINEATAAETVFATSVYVRLLQSGDEFLVQPNERYFPASLRKLPLMMQYFREAELDPHILTEKKPLETESDANLGATIFPRVTPAPNEEYSALELIEFMIKYSDNVSFQVLFNALGEQWFNRVYEAMQLEYPGNFALMHDHRTPLDYALFFRTLYNATYLTLENSEKALELLTQTDYVNGIVRWLPSQVPVAHKFGVAALTNESGRQYGELHDCGIVYKPDNPYLLCIMTKSYAPQISPVEDMIAQISASVYEDL